jgi:hypothetical protein
MWATIVAMARGPPTVVPEMIAKVGWLRINAIRIMC